MEASLATIEENQVSTTNLVNNLQNTVDKINETVKKCMQSLDNLHEKVEN